MLYVLSFLNACDMTSIVLWHQFFNELIKYIVQCAKILSEKNGFYGENVLGCLKKGCFVDLSI